MNRSSEICQMGRAFLLFAHGAPGIGVAITVRAATPTSAGLTWAATIAAWDQGDPV
jgi:hypothetical protein